MKIFRHTLSLCPTCFKEIPAFIDVRPDGVFINKTCDAHGMTEAMLERDPLFYLWVKGQNSPMIYNGHFVDVTRVCQLRCKACYYPLEKKNPEHLFSVEQIVNECKVNGHRPPFILTGGEPTLHPELAKVIAEIKKFCPAVEIVTNGVKLADEDYFDEIVPLLTNPSGHAFINLSIHEDQTDKWLDVILLCRKNKIVIESGLIVVDSKESFWRAVEIAEENKDVIKIMRIKVASRIWHEQKPDDNEVFVSDMISWLEEEAKVHKKPCFVQTGRFNKSVLVNIQYGDLHLMLVKWHNVRNIDLIDIDCAPTHRARNGQVLNLVTAFMVNEGLEAGYLNGLPINLLSQTQSKSPQLPAPVPEQEEVVA